mmetsp:Transcript_50231/g.74998  ORF Transcript_50231/g.74998 Transcript_50231/m.74998 type:complete len:241 (+) Transcript_50231:225-947(+)
MNITRIKPNKPSINIIHHITPNHATLLVYDSLLHKRSVTVLDVDRRSICQNSVVLILNLRPRPRTKFANSLDDSFAFLFRPTFLASPCVKIDSWLRMVITWRHLHLADPLETASGRASRPPLMGGGTRSLSAVVLAFATDCGCADSILVLGFRKHLPLSENLFKFSQLAPIKKKFDQNLPKVAQVKMLLAQDIDKLRAAAETPLSFLAILRWANKTMELSATLFELFFSRLAIDEIKKLV